MGQKHSHKITHGIAKRTKNTFLNVIYRAIIMQFKLIPQVQTHIIILI